MCVSFALLDSVLGLLMNTRRLAICAACVRVAEQCTHVFNLIHLGELPAELPQINAELERPVANSVRKEGRKGRRMKNVSE